MSIKPFIRVLFICISLLYGEEMRSYNLNRQIANHSTGHVCDDSLYINQSSYFITSEVDLKGKTLSIPDNGFIIFEGGKLLNGRLEGNNSSIVATSECIFENVDITGRWSGSDVYPEWFGAKGDKINDDSDAIQKAANIASGNQLVFTAGKQYLCKKSVLVKSNTTILGNDATIIKACYSPIFINEHYDKDIVDDSITIENIVGETLDNNYRGLWVWLVGVKDTRLYNCILTNQTPIDKEGQPQWCITLSGENIEISNCVINTLGGGAFSDGIHLYNATNCKIHDCIIMTDDDCIGFCPEIPTEQKRFKKFNNSSDRIEIYNNQLAGKNNCIRFEIRDNAPRKFSYNNVFIHDIGLGGDGLTVGSFLYLHDFRRFNLHKNTNFRITNISCRGSFNSYRRNFIEIYGKNPELLPKNVCNIASVSISGINVSLSGFENYLCSIGAKDVDVHNCVFKEEDNSWTGVSIRDCSKYIISDCHFITFSPYTFMNIANSTGSINNNEIERISPSNTSGIAVSVDSRSEKMIVNGNRISNFAIGISVYKNADAKEANEYDRCNLKIRKL